MNAVEIEEAVSLLVEQPFHADEFPYEFLTAFGNKKTTIQRLRKGNTNKSDIQGGVLQRSNIHIAVCQPGEVTATLQALLASPQTAAQKAKYALATDGQTVEAENIAEGETLACDYAELGDQFGFFLQLAGITTVKQIRENAFDIKATSRLNKLYVELLKENPDWDTAERREEFNHFMARLIFCFFAEDTNIFNGVNLFTRTMEQMTASDSSNTHEVLSEIFRAMKTKQQDRDGNDFRGWAVQFPYVNGGLFSGSVEVPRFSKIARSYLIHIGHLDWTKINPDIFGSMIQAVADDEERGALGMHYTSVPNILKVLNPLFLNDLRDKLEQARTSKRKLLNLRKRLARIRVFDPACGSGNFLVIAYKEMRKIEAEINERRGEADRRSDIPLTNFRGIEIRHFSAEIARLALIIAEYQCDVLYRGQQLALAEFLPLESDNWITCGNALRLDWLKICPPTGREVKVQNDDLINDAKDQAEKDFENEGGETYIFGNPPYAGTKKQTRLQKEDLKVVLSSHTDKWKVLDYVSAWFVKAAEYGIRARSTAAFVCTNSICQGQQAPALWPALFELGNEILFAHASFKWANLASLNAGVTVVIVGIGPPYSTTRRLIALDDSGDAVERNVENVNAYLAPAKNVLVYPRRRPLSDLPDLARGNSPTDGGHLILKGVEFRAAFKADARIRPFIKRFFGSNEVISGNGRFCIWIDDQDIDTAKQVSEIRERIQNVKEFRQRSTKPATQKASNWPHRFDERKPLPDSCVIVIPVRSSENREFLPIDVLPPETVIANTAFSLVDGPLWVVSIVASRIHLAWIAAVCGRLELRYSYTNTVGWNTFPVPDLTDTDKAELTRCAEDILLAREAHFPATIADLYDPENMPADLRAAHDRNDLALERIYIGRRFKNDTERLEVLFDMYTKMTS